MAEALGAPGPSELPENVPIPDVALPEGFALVHATERLGAWRRAIAEAAMDISFFRPPGVIGLVGMGLWQELQTNMELVQYQRLVIDEARDEIVGYAYCVPYFCRSLELSLASNSAFREPLPLKELLRSWARFNLPEGGLTTMLFRGVRQAHARTGRVSNREAFLPWTPEQLQSVDSGIAASSQKPNVLCGIHIAVKPGLPDLGVPQVLIESLKTMAREQGLMALVVPVSLTTRSLYGEPFDSYFHWPNGRPFNYKESWVNLRPLAPRRDWRGRPMMPFDPWLRMHLERGAKMVKFAPHNMQVSQSVSRWVPFITDAYKYLVMGDEPYPWLAEGDVAGHTLHAIPPAPGLPERLQWNEEEGVLVYEDKAAWWSYCGERVG